MVAAATLTICTWLQASPPVIVIAAVAGYFLVFFINEDLDVNSLLLRGEESLEELTSQADVGLKVAKVIVFILFFFLPIPKPPGYLVGIPALVIVAVLIYLNQDSWEQGSLLGFLTLTLICVGSVALGCYILKLVWLVNVPVLPLLTGLALPNLIDPIGRERSLAERGIEYPPGLPQVVYTFLLTWITPGLSLSAATSGLIAPGVYRALTASLTSAALEAWNISLILRGGQASKTVLAYLLLRPNSINHVPALDGQGIGYGALVAVFLIAVLPALIFYWRKSERIEVNQAVVVFAMVSQSVAVTGLTAIPLIVLGLAIALLQRNLMPDSPEVRSLAVMAPMIIS
ncbi:MAG: hypothetical protein EA343_20645 [Nodularia sp. (in: Bacteria)]|nr:MAG: hypothetical protein EA343_20645 [Nodularia sp. (in: cyanobacteria)]